jgi:hypothetical protein
MLSQKVSSIMQIETLFYSRGLHLLGLSCHVNPDWFRYPEDGLFKSFSFIRVAHIASNHLDPITQLTLILCGSSMLAIGFMSWFANNAMAKKHALHTFLYKNLFCFLAFWQAARSESIYLNYTTIALSAGIFLTSTLWLATESLRLSKESDTLMRTSAEKPESVMQVANMLLCYLVWSSACI